ncbi:MAG: SH3 domain-containing protein [Candidatus Omnitrophica bacterium]|nr:SH3 domain-containing protein [Candidatus Omnitrophota bacterium]
MIGILALILASGNLYFVSYKSRETSGMAIITGEETESYYGPFDSATAFFKLHRGMTVEVIQKSQGWYKIRRGDGKVGWVKSGELEVI